MDAAITRLLQDKLYDKRKAGALELEAAIRNALLEGNHNKIAKIVHQLCHDYAYAVHQPHARNGGLIGLAAAAIALGPEVARYLKEIVPPVLACFSDQDARVRYYACESMYNIAKVAKGEVLVYFNDVFDALCKLAADTELSVKNGAELLDRLVKDIVSESAATYTSTIQHEPIEDLPENELGQTKAFSLPRFIPLLKERILVLNPFTRTFLISWITLLDSIPDLELVAYLPSFLGGLLKFLSDPNQDVHTIARAALDRFLAEITRIAAVKQGLIDNKRGTLQLPYRNQSKAGSARRSASSAHVTSPKADEIQNVEENPAHIELDDTTTDDQNEDDDDTSLSAGHYDEDEAIKDESDGEWISGQDVYIDYQQILEIISTFLAESREREVQVTALKWIEKFLDICPEDILLFTPKLLSQLLPALSHDVDYVKQAAARVNQALMAYIESLPEEPSQPESEQDKTLGESSAGPTNKATQQVNSTESGRSSPFAPRAAQQDTLVPTIDVDRTSTNADVAAHQSAHWPPDLDYEAAVGALTDQFIHQHEATRVAALAWLIMLHRKSPRKILAIQEATFPALLKTLSDPAETVVRRDLLLLSQISKSSDDTYFASFMVNLLKLFGTDRSLLESRGNLIIRQLCLSLPAEKIYRTMADWLENNAEEDAEFAAIMVQNLNNNLLTAPELDILRKRLRNLDTREGQALFTVLFRSWCVNGVATVSLCLLAQAYEQAYELLKIFADAEMTVGQLIQIDKLVQLLESPVFTYLRMQLIEPERYPSLYKCMYGILMLLPQSAAFAALKNRLNSVSAIGYLNLIPRPPTNSTSSAISSFERQNRLKSRDVGDGGIRWAELLEKFRQTQDRIRRQQRRDRFGPDYDSSDDKVSANKEAWKGPTGVGGPGGPGAPGPEHTINPPRPSGLIQQPSTGSTQTKAKSGLGHFSRLTSSVGKSRKDKEKK